MAYRASGSWGGAARRVAALCVSVGLAATFPSGSYVLVSLASGPGGSKTSFGVSITVKN